MLIGGVRCTVTLSAREQPSRRTGGARPSRLSVLHVPVLCAWRYNPRFAVRVDKTPGWERRLQIKVFLKFVVIAIAWCVHTTPVELLLFTTGRAILHGSPFAIGAPLV